MAARGGRDRSQVYGTVLFSLATTYLCGIGLSVILLLGHAHEFLGALHVTVLLGVLTGGAVALHPVVLRRILALVSPRAAGSVGVFLPPWKITMGLVAANLPAWLAVGLATWCVSRGFGMSAPLIEVMLATSLSWVVGFLVVPAPGGLGVREAAFTLAAVSLSGGSAATVAVVARVMFIVVDALGAAVLSLVNLLDRGR